MLADNLQKQVGNSYQPFSVCCQLTFGNSSNLFLYVVR
jgi:hypothetical protein